MLKEEAEKEVEELRKLKKQSWYCPLIKSFCRTDCIAYYKPALQRGKLLKMGETSAESTYDWEVSSAACMCHSIVGQL